ncbi:LexA family transcriptional regulator [Marinilongibacter aquaticus]|uniref:XRE family transcriptional regulator n=1 Tax=Marinilongibacter aquaticus TaxID=2975157 RepID=UPI0021BDD181|nr:LexA family transcriptional regulator [Marinilongibacter aquaticus]UBM57779.1 LexA family transcriptional regulator [Marinilongibacter aquaticus]
MKESTESLRFKSLREDLGFTQAEFGKLLGLSSSTADIERGKTRITGKSIMLLLKQFKINPLWIYGESEQKFLESKKNAIIPKTITVDREGKDNIVLVPAKASAGYGQNIGDSRYLEQFSAFRMPIPEFHHASFRGFQITGDSMVPLVYNNDWIFAKALNDYSEVRNEGVYVIIQADSIRLKKLRKPSEDVLELHSLNPDYPPVQVDRSSVLEVWEYHSRMAVGVPAGGAVTLEHVYAELRRLGRRIGSD